MSYLQKSENLINYFTSLFLGLILLVSFSAHAQWNDAWVSRTKVAINSSEVTEALNNILIPVRLHSGNFDFSTANADGSDLRVIAADDKTELKFYLERFDAANELAVLWVQLPQLSAANKDASFWIYSGNAEATSTSNAAIFSDKNVVMRLSFNDKTPLADSSSQKNSINGNPVPEKAGLVGSSVRLDKTPLVVATKLSSDIAQGLTFSVWVKPNAIPQKSNLLEYGQLALKLDADALILSLGNAQIKGGQLTANIWHHVAVSIAAGNAKLYLDGKETATGQVSLSSLTGDLQIGANFSGELDEVELLDVAKNASWIKVVNSSYGVDGKMLSFTTEEGEAEGGESYFGILFNSLTIDAEVVIAILAIMFLISVWVMYSKAILIIKTDKENAEFLKRFQDSNSQNLLTLDAGLNLPNSTLLGLYKAGVAEIRKREKTGAKLVLGAASMSAIRASVDAELVRKNQSLNNLMVLLTIAISGGPFLGLLGTVVGVMITFAAIAAAGDVNVNAIAPGIAAALLATVAGLGVAIPALFGYNYLASRIKNITISMQIFVDEFVTRAAEQLSKD
jgi:biopolymer transport protein ExbB